MVVLVLVLVLVLLLVRQRKLPFSVTVMRKAKEQGTTEGGLRAANDHAERVLLLLRVIQCQVLASCCDTSSRQSMTTTTTTTTTPVRVIIIVIVSGHCCCCCSSFQSCSLSSISHFCCSLDLPKGRRRVVVTVEHLSCSRSIEAGQLRSRVKEKRLLLLLLLVQGVQVVGVLGRLEVTS